MFIRNLFRDFLTCSARQGRGGRKEKRDGRSVKMRENRGRKKKRDRRSEEEEEEESRYHNIAVIPGSVSFQIIQKPADRTYIPGPTRSSYRVIIVEGPNTDPESLNARSGGQPRLSGVCRHRS